MWIIRIIFGKYILNLRRIKMKSNKRIVLILMMSIISSLFMSCNNSSVDNIYYDNSEIAKEYDTFSLYDSDEQIVKEGSYRGNLKLSGSGTIWKYVSDKDTDLQVLYNLVVKDGNAKVVLISPDNNVVTITDNEEQITLDRMTSINVPIKKGTNRIKIVGYKNPNIKLELHIDKGEFRKIDL